MTKAVVAEKAGARAVMITETEDDVEAYIDMIQDDTGRWGMFVNIV